MSQEPHEMSKQRKPRPEGQLIGEYLLHQHGPANNHHASEKEGLFIGHPVPRPCRVVLDTKYNSSHLARAAPVQRVKPNDRNLIASVSAAYR